MYIRDLDKLVLICCDDLGIISLSTIFLLNKNQAWNWIWQQSWSYKNVFKKSNFYSHFFAIQIEPERMKSLKIENEQHSWNIRSIPLWQQFPLSWVIHWVQKQHRCQKTEAWCQFHQHFMYKFFVRTLFRQLFLHTCN